MAALPYPVLPAGSLPTERAAFPQREADKLWLALQLLDPDTDSLALESLAAWAESLTPMVVLRPGEGLLLELRGSLRYFAGLGQIRQRLTDELERRGWSYRLATAPTPLAAAWLARDASIDVGGQQSLAGALGRLPLAVTGWPESVLRALAQMGLKSIADCLRLPRAGFARRLGRAWLEELDRALGIKPDPRNPWRPPRRLQRRVEFSLETRDQVEFAAALSGMVDSIERELRRRQAQVDSLTLRFRHLRSSDTSTRIGFIDPVHERSRILPPVLARIERIELAEPAVALLLETSKLRALEAEVPDLLTALPRKHPAAKAARHVPEFALIECLRARFGTRSVYGIDAVAEHRPERAWRRSSERPAARVASADGRLPAQGRPLWLLPEPRCQAPFEPCQAPLPERIESGWWDGQDIRRDYHIVVGAAGEKLWCYRDCRSHEWYLHGVFG